MTYSLISNTLQNMDDAIISGILFTLMEAVACGPISFKMK